MTSIGPKRFEMKSPSIVRHITTKAKPTWSSPFQHLSLYQAWRTVATARSQHRGLGADRISKVRSESAAHAGSRDHSFAATTGRSCNPSGPHSYCAKRFRFPDGVRGRSTKRVGRRIHQSQQDDLAGLLAIRLAYDVVLAQAKSISIDWSSLAAERIRHPSSRLDRHRGDDSVLRYTCLRASEIGFRKNSWNRLSIADNDAADPSTPRKLAQMVFCIDVRSERIRRQLESVSGEIETFGFAGFFGMPIEFVPMGETDGNSHVPVLLKPQFKLLEGLHDSHARRKPIAVANRKQIRSWRAIWKKFPKFRRWMFFRCRNDRAVLSDSNSPLERSDTTPNRTMQRSMGWPLKIMTSSGRRLRGFEPSGYHDITPSRFGRVDAAESWPDRRTSLAWSCSVAMPVKPRTIPWPRDWTAVPAADTPANRMLAWRPCC